ncbi:ATP-dependent RNA helicase SUB2 [Serendipita indica DSM 11827]|nr:ATP-dependent RNA helicase SUB2 [Serendipita indica DSM 11827]
MRSFRHAQPDMRRDVQEIFRITPHSKQVMMFSATLSKEIRVTCKKFMNNPLEIFIDGESKLTLHDLQQYFLRLEETQKNRKLNDLLDTLDFNQVVIFVKSVGRAVELDKLLRECGFPGTTVHSGLSQEERISRYKEFKNFESVSSSRLTSLDAVSMSNVSTLSSTTILPQTPTRTFTVSGELVASVPKADLDVLEQIQSRFEIAITGMPAELDKTTYMERWVRMERGPGPTPAPVSAPLVVRALPSIPSRAAPLPHFFTPETHQDLIGDDEEIITIWDYYNANAARMDADTIKDANDTAQVLLTFAGLFSAAVAAFIPITFSKLSPDPNEILLGIFESLNNGESPSSRIQPPPAFGIRVNIFLFGAISIALGVAVLCILVNQWASNYQREIVSAFSSPHHRARAHYFLHSGIEWYDFIGIVDWLSLLMLLAVLLAMVGISDLIFSTCPRIGYIPVISFALCMAFVLWKTIQAYLHPDAPFRSPLSHVLTRILKTISPIPVNRRNKGHVLKKRHSTLINRASTHSRALQTSGVYDEAIDEDHTSIKQYVKSYDQLDLDIISQIMHQADTATERWLLDLCFKKLPSLEWLTCNFQQNEMLLYPSILKRSIFLAKTCIKKTSESPGSESKTLVPGRFQRAETLSEFLVWLLPLASAELRTKLCDEDLVTPWMDMLHAYSWYALSTLGMKGRPSDNSVDVERLIKAVCTAYTALGLLAHRFQFNAHSLNPCSVCESGLTNLRQAVQRDIDSSKKEDLNDLEEAKNKQILFAALLGFLTMRCDCIVGPYGSWLDNEPGEIASLVTKRFASEAITTSEAFYTVSEEEKRILLKILKERKMKVGETEHRLWFALLVNVVQSLTIMTTSPIGS